MELKQYLAVEIAEKLKLLIVPYGIETIAGLERLGFRRTFNCTLWN